MKRKPIEIQKVEKPPQTLIDSRIIDCERTFQEYARSFNHMMGPYGGGIRTVAMLDTLRGMLQLYQNLAALHYAKDAVQHLLNEKELRARRRQHRKA